MGWWAITGRGDMTKDRHYGKEQHVVWGAINRTAGDEVPSHCVWRH